MLWKSFCIFVNMKRFAIIVAGGSGTRFGTAIPKQFLDLRGIPVLMHTIKAFYDAVPDVNVVLVLPKDQMAMWQNLCERHRFDLPMTVVAGGETRYRSVKNGLDAILSDEGLVAVHDGVRPLVSKTVIVGSYEVAEKNESAIPAVEVTDSVRMLTDSVKSVALDRSSLRAVQTPQTFILSQLRDAYSKGYSPLFTDDASVYEASGREATLFPGDSRNIKITRREDLALAELLMKEK